MSSELFGWGSPLERLLGASPLARASSQHGGWAPRVSSPRGRAGWELSGFYDQASEVTRPQFCHTPWTVMVTSPYNLSEGGVSATVLGRVGGTG